ncbi:hypothetical protein Hanom_Chr03g00195941 [Helianthus anomalus]
MLKWGFGEVMDKPNRISWATSVAEQEHRWTGTIVSLALRMGTSRSRCRVRALFDFNNNQPELLPFIPDLSGSDCSEVTWKTTAISSSPEVVDKQFEKP